MRNMFRSRAWGCLARIAASCLGAIALAGCATGYVYLQPDTASGGGYYTGEEGYSGQGYYDYYGTGPYYPGTSGYGYYSGTYPNSGVFGLWGGYGGGYGYVPRLTFNVGISNVWNFPGYWGPWYSTVIPVWRCRRQGCNRYPWRGHRHDWRTSHRQAGSHGAIAVAPSSHPNKGTATPPMAFADDPRVRSGVSHSGRFLKTLPTLLPPGQFGNGYRRASTRIVRPDPVHAASRIPTTPRAVVPAQPAYRAHALKPALANQRPRMWRAPALGPRDFSAAHRTSYRAPVPKFINRAALTRDRPPVYRASRTSAQPAYRSVVPVYRPTRSSSSRKSHTYKPKGH